MRQAQYDLTPEMQFGGTLYKNPSLVWYFRKHVNGWMANLEDGEVKSFMEMPGPRFVIVSTKMAAELYPTIPDGWKTYSARGLDTTNGTRLDLTLLLKPS